MTDNHYEHCEKIAGKLRGGLSGEEDATFKRAIVDATRLREFKLSPEQLSFPDRNLEPVVEPGTLRVMACGSSKDIRRNGELEVKQ